ncbi:hypothetical protein AB0H34_28855 [Saccharopolyspora shandongensis]|uniref:hypothetical protein n=1 Tax=Saccharopolyspora shandongensis TaxID=418495 RepID=UPI0033F2408B
MGVDAVPNLEKLKKMASRRFFWTFLFFLCVFGFGAWLFAVQSGPEIATILSLVVSIIALIASPSESRNSVWIALASAFLVVAAGALGYVLYDNLRSVNVTANVRFDGTSEGTTELVNDQAATFTIATDESRDNLTIGFEITDAPTSSRIQDCRTDPDTGISLKLDSQPVAIRLSPSESATVPVHDAREIHGAVTMHARQECRVQVHVASAELHN